MSCSLSTVLVTNTRGDLLVSRQYRDDVSTRTAADAFKTQIVLNKLSDRAPIRSIGSLSFLWIRHKDVFVVGVTRTNLNAATALEALHKLVNIFEVYFEYFNEQVAKDNYIMIYELLDEIFDYGFVQNTEVDILRQFIRQDGRSIDIHHAKKVAIDATGTVNWRPEGLFYEKNEVYLDVLEEVNVLMSPKASVLTADVSGKVVMRTQLTGMPDCRIGLNDRMSSDATKRAHYASVESASSSQGGIKIDDITFDRCVKLGNFDVDRSISFVPHDGEFELMGYRITENILLPFRLLPPIVREVSRTLVEYNITIKADFSPQLIGKNVQVIIPCPSNTSNTKMNVSGGKAKYEPTQHAVVWRFKKFPGGAEYNLRGEANLINTVNLDQTWSKPPIRVSFQVGMAASGLKVRYLKVVEPKYDYETIKWVRYITKAGNYEIRI